MTETTRTFTPDWVSSPGDAIADFLEERDWTQTQLAERLGYTAKHISELINGKAPINEETALKLERVMGSTAAFWLRYEAQYRAALARIEEENRLKEWTTSRNFYFWVVKYFAQSDRVLLPLLYTTPDPLRQSFLLSQNLAEEFPS